MMLLLLLSVVASDAGVPDPDQPLLELLARLNVERLEFGSSTSQARWVAFGGAQRERFCIEGGCVRRSKNEPIDQALFDETAQRVAEGEAGPVPPRIEELLILLSRTYPDATLRPLQVEPGIVLPVRGASAPFLEMGDSLRVLTANRRRLAAAAQGGWWVLEGDLEEQLLSVSWTQLGTMRRPVLLLVTASFDGGSGMAEGSATLQLYEFSATPRLLGTKPIGRWVAVGKGWSVGGPTAQDWLWPRIINGRLRLERSAPPTRWTRQGRRRSLPADKLVAEIGDWCLEADGLRRCAVRDGG